MFTKTADFYDALYHFKDYKAECHRISEFIRQHIPHARTLLDVACGTGKHIESLRENFEVQGLDLNRELLEIGRKRCPDVSFHEADMTTFSLPDRFDVVGCFFSSIAYVQTVENLKKAVQRMAAHLNPGGLLLIEPWITPEKYWIGKITANHVDQPELKISWMYTSEISDRTSVFDIHYLVGTPKGIQQFTENHTMGLWTDEEYRNAFKQAGLQADYDPDGFIGRGLYYGRKL